MVGDRKPKTKPTRSVLVRRFSMLGALALAGLVVTRDALPWSWGLFATLATISFANFAATRRGWIQAEGRVTTVILIVLLSVSRGMFYRDVPLTWSTTVYGASLMFMGMAFGAMLAVAVPESDNVPAAE